MSASDSGLDARPAEWRTVNPDPTPGEQADEDRGRQADQQDAADRQHEREDHHA